MTWRADEAPGIRFRQRGDRKTESLDITTYGRNAIRDAVGHTVGSLDIDLESVAAAAIYQPDGKLPYRASRDLPIDNQAVQAGTVVDRIGDAGAATVPIGLLFALADDTADLSVAAFFGGGGTASALACSGNLQAKGLADLDDGEVLPYAEYLRKRGYVVSGDVAGGVRTSVSRTGDDRSTNDTGLSPAAVPTVTASRSRLRGPARSVTPGSSSSGLRPPDQGRFGR
ncbi:hypothetical protein [Halalkalicoccus salilacus]|uniref:hypothetical protein n=1 Tax=Halalkalicoccus sp. GCM10025704 TaxID=3252662 RepID=UPI003610E4B7